jgi:hypothetical protein
MIVTPNTPRDSSDPGSDPSPDPTTDPIPTPTDPAPAPADPGTPSSSTNTPPTISGTVITSVAINSLYSFKPTASDSDGDALTFQIQNKPVWSAFSTATGQLSGTPTQSDVGAYANIVISASDGVASAALPAFSIAVTQPSANGVTLSWIAPTENVDGSTLMNLAGFMIVYGPSKSMLHEVVRVNNPGADRYVLDLPSGSYYFAIKAYTSGGVESALSNLVSTVVL